MIKSRFKLLTLIGRVFILVVGIGALIMTLIFVNVLIKDFDTVGLIAALVFSMLSMGFIYTSLDSIKSISVDTERQTIIINYLGLFKRIIVPEDIKGYKLQPFSNRFGTFRGVLIESKNSKQYRLSEFDYTNYLQLENQLKKIVPYNSNIRLNYFPTFAKVFYVYVGLIIAFMIVAKTIGI